MESLEQDEDILEDDEEDYESSNWQISIEEISTKATGASSEVDRSSPTPRHSLTSNVLKASHDRCIIHVDFDCFYAQVEMIKNPTLKDKPIAVYQKHALVTSNYLARGLGVKKMSNKTDALTVCPNLVLVNGEDLSPYRQYSVRMFELMREFSPLVERVGLDENYIDVTANVEELLASTALDSVIKGHCYGFEGIIDMVNDL